MAPVHIVLVGGVNHRARIARYPDVFDLEFAGSEQRGRAARSGSGVQMVPAILFRSENDAVPREVKRLVCGKIRKRSLELIGAVPDRVSFTGNGISNINRPGIGTYLKKGKTLFEAVDADKGDLLAVARPARHGVT